MIYLGIKLISQKINCQIDTEEVKKFAQENNMTYFEASCVTREGIEEGFSYFANELYEKLEKEKIINNNIEIKNNKTKKDSNSKGNKGKNNK